MASRPTEIAQVDPLLEIKMANLNSLSRVRGFILVGKSLSIFFARRPIGKMEDGSNPESVDPATEWCRRLVERC